MRTTRRTLLLLSILTACLTICSILAAEKPIAPIKPAASFPDSTPWDLSALSKAPTFEWLDRGDKIRSLLYRGERYKGKPTKVFAYYGTPGTLRGDISQEQHFPGVVLVHGGGGQAFKEWVELWAKRGYAAIAMDLAGCGLDRNRLPDGGPGQGDEEKFGQMDRPVTDQWTYHAVANVILAHSLLRSFEEVDAHRTAVTGISWGGYLTCIVAGLDSRFRAAVPVYGCGFLHENSVWLPRFAKMTPEHRDKWVNLLDPSRYIGSAAMPIFFVNGTNDFAYPLDSYARTYRLVKAPRNFRITIRMPHSHKDGWNPEEIGLFVDQCLRGGTPLPTVKTPEIVNEKVQAEVVTETTLTSASLHYTTDTGPINKRNWETKPATIDGDRVVVSKPPAESTLWFITVSDQRDAVVSSELVFADK